MPGILDCPPEILELIIDELAFSPALASELVDSVHQRLSRRIFSLGQTCQFFYQFILPRLYSNCFLEFHAFFYHFAESPQYRLYDSSAVGTVQKHNGFLKHGSLVKDLNIRFDELADWPHPAQEWKAVKWSEFQEVSQPAPNILEKLLPRFDRLNRVEFQRDTRTLGSLGDFVRGLDLVLSRVTSLTALDLSIQYNTEDKSDWAKNAVEIEHSSFAARLRDLSISVEPKSRELDWNEEPTDHDLLDCFWFMDVLIQLLSIPSQTVKTLNFEFILEQFGGCPLGRRWLKNRENGPPTKIVKNRLELPLVSKLYLTLGNGCQFAYENCFKITHGEVKDLSLQLITLPGGEWLKEISFIKGFPKLTAITLYHPRDIELVEVVVASLQSDFIHLKELRVVLFTPSSYVRAIIDKFGKGSRIQVEKFDSRHSSATVRLHF
ncbi:hypothetical protein TWF225_009498 [Orbilia oligospora]|uniref:Uncharacterized protein n=1 Tax=Orbilia oligospora TaxID=2813651 RepID=A0A7C8P1R6_ORBOL|nr:hypothetical protein TWF751_002555 [Orbilia oligospora]KAF3174417.1 hypothetical protein TWF225_009498 [Orbilia oligospora]KAF3247763.1 hypothetical protein TWF217_009560 [Orbilia oligospora]KAF3258787.1 hypothetical protein TWF128_004581 [Orbilia oligospora]KAF3258788.1 hypothetical protein TWF128_004581 [Orbilia oligospora]